MAIVTTADKGAFPDVSYFPPEEIVPEALIRIVGTEAGSIEGDEPKVRVPFVSDDVTADFVDEGADITAADPTLDELEFATGKVAVLTKVSREAYSKRGIVGLLSTSLRRSVTTKADATFLGSAVPPLGLASTVGVIDAGTLGVNLDAIHDAITACQLNGGNPTALLMDPASWGVIMNLKAATDSNQSLVDANSPTLANLPRYVSNHMPSGTLLVVDRSQIITAVGMVALSTSEHRYFEADSLALRVTWRIGWGIVRPDRHAKVTVTIPEGS